MVLPGKLQYQRQSVSHIPNNKPEEQQHSISGPKKTHSTKIEPFRTVIIGVENIIFLYLNFTTM